MTIMNETSTFIKKMASPDAKIRDRAVRTVQTFLSTKGDSLSYDEFLKLWKGFFYCFWLSDKTEGQFALAELIAKLVHNLSFEKKGDFAESGAALFLRSFWETMGREWPRLDRLRLNKYYNLMKNVLHQSFQMIAIASETEESCTWSHEIVKGHTAILFGTVFDRSNQAYPESIRNYVIENYFELLKSCSAEPFSPEMTILVCEPIIHAVAYCGNKAFFKQASEALIQGLLPGGDCEDEDCSDEDECGDHCEMSHGEDSDCSECDSKEDSENAEISDVSDEEAEMQECSEDDEEACFDSEEFDNIKDDGSDLEDEKEDADEEESGSCCSVDDHEHSEDEKEEEFIFDYALLSKFIFDFGAREDVLVRNRRFLYELSQIIEDVSTGAMEACDQEGESCCQKGESCCN